MWFACELQCGAIVRSEIVERIVCEGSGPPPRRSVYGHVPPYEPDPALRTLLSNFFADDGLAVTGCASLADTQAATDEHPEATVVLDSSWADHGYADRGDAEREVLNDLSRRTAVIVTTARSWAYNVTPLNLAPAVTLVPKPYDVEELRAIVRESRHDYSGLRARVHHHRSRRPCVASTPPAHRCARRGR